MKQIFCIMILTLCAHGLFAQDGFGETNVTYGTAKMKHFGKGGRVTFLETATGGKVTHVGFFMPPQGMTELEFKQALELLFEVKPDQQEYSEIFYLLHMRASDCGKGNYETALRCLEERANDYLTSLR